MPRARPSRPGPGSDARGPSLGRGPAAPQNWTCSQRTGHRRHHGCPCAAGPPTISTSGHAAPGVFRRLRGGWKRAQCLGMMNFTELPSVRSDRLVPVTDQLRLAVAAYLARFKGSSREHTESDLRCYLAWCAERHLDPLAARRPHLEWYIRWMQEVRFFKPSTVSRRVSVAARVYRTRVIDRPLEHLPAAYVPRAAVPAASP